MNQAATLPPPLLPLVSAPRLLIAADFDGTLAPIVPRPADARLHPRSRDAILRLLNLRQTAVAVISGRPLLWLRQALPPDDRLLLFASHGAEGPGAQDAVDPSTLASIREHLSAVARRHPGTFMEEKPFGAAVHFRSAPDAAERIRAAVSAVADALPGVRFQPGISVAEIIASQRTKAHALASARYRSAATHTLFLGDDVTDHDAFAALSEHDRGVTVGPDTPPGPIHLPDVPCIADLLHALADARDAWLAQNTPIPIQHHALLSDQRTAAILSPRGRIVWLCLPRIDSSAVFAELLGGPAAGFFAVNPDHDATPLDQSCDHDSLIVRTRWPSFTLTDYLDCSGGRAFQRAGRSDLVRVIDGRGMVRITFSPRLDFGRTATSLRPADGGLEVLGAPDPFVLYAPGLQWSISADGSGDTAVAVADLDNHGGSIALELRWGAPSLRPAAVTEPQRRAGTHRHWAGWVATLRLPEPWREPLARSALTLRALCHGPSGAIAAAATTSLPEQLGGVRNWDYRFCWPRDAAMAAAALLRLGNTGHAMKLADWLIAVVDRLPAPDRFRPIYSVSGDDLPPEAEISSLHGYAHSRPVRISNAAAQQVQLDVFGHIVDMVALMARRSVPISPDYWRLVRGMVRAVESRWQEPDHGIWEIRGPLRHHTHSKVLCWTAIDRALTVHDAVIGSPNPEWAALRDRIRDDILARAWSDRAGAFTAAYGCDDLDAASLLIGLSGLLPPDDPRWQATVHAVERGLRRENTVLRYTADDGLPGSEGGFIICAAWLVEALALTGRARDAAALLRSLCDMAGPAGLLPEQWDWTTSSGLGNFPQAYSHLGLINAAIRLHELGAA